MSFEHVGAMTARGKPSQLMLGEAVGTCMRVEHEMSRRTDQDIEVQTAVVFTHTDTELCAGRQRA
jgi:hypothetical protein